MMAVAAAVAAAVAVDTVAVGVAVVDGKIVCWSGAEVKKTGWEEWW